MKIICCLILVCLCSEILTSQNVTQVAQQIAANMYEINYSITTQEGYNMDCLKILYTPDKFQVGIFHSSKGQTDNYNRLYAAFRQNSTSKFKILSKLSDRGSQGTIHAISPGPNISNAYAVAYQLQSHEHGNTYALRYYEDFQHLVVNNFLYEYQFKQVVGTVKVRNIGTPSIELISIVKNQTQPRFNDYTVNLKFHYSPDGSHDYPGVGTANLNPLRDFVDQSGKFIGGCKQNYTDWNGLTDTKLQNAMLKIGVTGKIGQRDSFFVQNLIKRQRYYLYEANLNSDFNWKNWRIFLYAQNQNAVVPIPFVFDKVIDAANPHVTIESHTGNTVVLQMSFFLPSEGMQPLSDATPGQVTVKTKINF